MKLARTLVLLAAATMLCAAGAFAQDLGKVPDKVITGKITSITVHNLKASTGLTREEKSCPIQIRLDTDPGLLLGIDSLGNTSPANIEEEMVDILKTAFNDDFPVTIRWRSAGVSYSQIVSVQVNRPPAAKPAADVKPAK